MPQTTTIPWTPTAAELEAARRLGPLPDRPSPADVLRLQRESGLTFRQVRFWLAELPRRQRARATASPLFLELRPPTADGSPAATAAHRAMATPLSVLLPSGLRVEVGPGFDPPCLRAVVETLSW